MKKQGLRRLGCAGLLLGLAGLVGGFCYDVMFAGIPYQNQTPELQEQYALHSGIASYLTLACALILATGFLLWFAGLHSNESSPRPPMNLS